MEDYLESELARRRLDRRMAEVAAQMVALATGVSPEAVISPRRVGSATCRARYLAMYLCHVAYDWPLHRVGEAFGRDRSTAGIACRWGEDARESPQIDLLLDHLEGAMRRMLDVPRVELAA